MARPDLTSALAEPHHAGCAPGRPEHERGLENYGRAVLSANPNTGVVGAARLTGHVTQTRRRSTLSGRMSRLQGSQRVRRRRPVGMIVSPSASPCGRAVVAGRGCHEDTMEAGHAAPLTRGSDPVKALVGLSHPCAKGEPHAIQTTHAEASSCIERTSPTARRTRTSIHTNCGLVDSLIAK